MGLRAQDDTHTLDQFHHPLVVRAKLAIASACHAHGKVPSHCVVTQWQDPQALGDAAQYASNALGYQRMWSIHPAQIRPILKSFMPAQDLLETAAHIVTEAARQAWAPIAVNGILHDRASYRYFWQVLERAQQTGCTLPHCVRSYFTP
jgi:citrate lyase subunit beta/citryl-CoA lyase